MPISLNPSFQDNKFKKWMTTSYRSPKPINASYDDILLSMVWYIKRNSAPRTRASRSPQTKLRTKLGTNCHGMHVSRRREYGCSAKYLVNFVFWPGKTETSGIALNPPWTGKKRYNYCFPFSGSSVEVTVCSYYSFERAADILMRRTKRNAVAEFTSFNFCAIHFISKRKCQFQGNFCTWLNNQ